MPRNPEFDPKVKKFYEENPTYNEKGERSSKMKKQYKIDCIADGIERAKMRMDHDKDIYEY